MKKRIDFEKENKLYYSLKEVADHFGENVSLVRYWEGIFDNIKPRKTEGGTSQYTQKDIEEFATVYHLVKEVGMTLEGAKQALKQNKDEETRKVQVIHKLESIRNELKAIIKEFDLL